MVSVWVSSFALRLEVAWTRCRSWVLMSEVVRAVWVVTCMSWANWSVREGGGSSVVEVSFRGGIVSE